MNIFCPLASHHPNEVIELTDGAQQKLRKKRKCISKVSMRPNVRSLGASKNHALYFAERLFRLKEFVPTISARQSPSS